MMRNSSEYVVVANQASTDIGVKVADALGLEFTSMERRLFADGEIIMPFLRILPEKH